MIPGLTFLFLLWWLGAGWMSVVLYRRLTGAILPVRSGARLGAMIGVLTFIGTTLILALTMAVAGKEVLDTMVKQNPDFQQVVNDPATLGAVFLIVSVMFFVFIVATCATGGALSARAAGRNASSTPTVPLTVQGELRCPRCDSTQVQPEKPRLGLWSGISGRSKIVMTCLQCGNKFQPGDVNNPNK
jgi:hypothetical protein